MARALSRFAQWWVLLLSLLPALLLAQPTSHAVVPTPPPVAASNIATVAVWNRHLADFRSAQDFPDVATRAKSAIARIEFLLDERTDETVRVQFTEIESKKLARLYYGPHLVFVLAEADMNPSKTRRWIASGNGPGNNSLSSSATMRRSKT